MRTIAVANQKGGCGKTTVSINLAACLAREGRRTLLVDMDPQGHCALGLAVPEEQIEVGIQDVLLSGSNGSRIEITRSIWQITANFDLAPSTTQLARFEMTMQGAADWEDRLADALSPVHDKYDFVIIDCPPHIGVLTCNALHAASEVIIPVDTAYFSLQGLTKQLETIEAIRRRREQPLEVRVLANLYDVRTKLGREILNELRRKFGPIMCHTFINFNTKLREGASFGQPITEYDPGSMGYRDFIRLARELISATAPESMPTTLIRQAEELTDRADKLLATSRPLFEKAGRLEEELTEAASDSTSTALQEAAALRKQIADSQEVSRTAVEPQPAASDTATQEAPTAPHGERKSSHEEVQRKIDQIYGAHNTSEGVMFVADAPGANKVSLAGDFNNWSPEATPMTPSDGGEAFKALLPLAPGRYRYRFVVDGQWCRDPHNTSVETNPFGDLNSVIEVGQ